MACQKVPHLCGGTLFDLLLETRKPRRKARNKLDGGSDNLSTTDLYKGFTYIITGERPDSLAGSTLEKCVSDYKQCKSSKGCYVPFTAAAERSAFDSACERKDPAVLERTAGVIENYLNLEKCEWLVRALIEVMLKDETVDKRTPIAVGYDDYMPVEDLPRAKKIVLLPFLVSVIHYVVKNCPDCESGRATFEAWYSQAGKRAEWKFREDNHLGDSIKGMNVVTDFEMPDGAQVEAAEECSAESAWQKDKNEPLEAEVIEETSKSSRVNGQGITIIHNQTNIEHDESQTFHIEGGTFTFNL